MKLPRIYYDHQIFSLQNRGGISRYFCEVFSEILKKTDAKIDVVFTSNIYLRALGFNIIDINIGYFKYPYFLINSIISAINIIRKKYDIYHTTYYGSYFLYLIGNKPFVVTIHDCAYEKYGGKTILTKLILRNEKKLIEKSAAIVCVSESTKLDLQKYYKIDVNKISVIHHGTNISNVSPICPAQLVSEKIKYILYVGQRDGYKNFSRFLKAISPIIINKKINLVCAGGGEFNSVEKKIMSRLCIEDRVIQINAKDDNQLSYLYRNATTFVYPSLYEGFGLPIIEAFSCKCPVVASNIPSFIEIAGDSVSYFDPEDTLSIFRSVNKVVSSKEVSTKLVEKGYRRSKKYTWERSSKKLIKVYNDIYNKYEHLH